MTWLEESKQYKESIERKYGIELEESRFSSSNRNLKDRLRRQGIFISDNTVMHHVNRTHLNKEPSETVMLIDAGSLENSEFIHKYLETTYRLNEDPLKALQNVKLQVGTIGLKDKKDGSQNPNPSSFHNISLAEAVAFELELRKEQDLSQNNGDIYQLDYVSEKLSKD